MSFTWRAHGGGGTPPREPSYRCNIGGIECRISPTLGLVDGVESDYVLCVAGARCGGYSTPQDAMKDAPGLVLAIANRAIEQINKHRRGDGHPMLYANRAI